MCTETTLDNDFIDICRYIVSVIINDNRNDIIVTNDLETANNWYELSINKFTNRDSNDHVIVYLFDYDKNVNINYYDSEVDN